MAGITAGSKIPSKTMTGARAVVMINENEYGIFTNCSVSSRQEKQGVFVLGVYGPIELMPLSQELIHLTLTGYKIQGKGPFSIGVATFVQDLIKEGDFTVKVIDRQQRDYNSSMDTNAMGKRADTLIVKRCRLLSWSTGFAARGASDLRLEIVGLEVEDESMNDGDNHEDTSKF